MTFTPVGNRPIDPVNFVGVAIKAIDFDARAMHVGLVYRSSSQGVRFAHLAFHHDLRNDPAPNDDTYLWSDCQWLADPAMAATADFVATFIEAVVIANSENVDYGVDATGTRFDQSGRFCSIDPRKGLTCATFIFAVFRDAGFPVVNIETWPSRAEDALWRDQVLSMLRTYGAPSRALEIGNEDAPFRLSPAEIAAATASPAVPLDFTQAVLLAEPVLKLLFPEPTAAIG